MKRKKLKLTAIAGLLITASCSSPKPEIPMDRFAEIVYETHRADAIIQIAGLNDKKIKNDSLSYYNDLFKKQGITREEFIKTIEWYVNNPEQYKELYKKVMNIVAQKEKEEEERIAKLQDTIAKDTNDIWNQRRDWRLPIDGERETIAFEIEDSLHGIYTLSADMIFYSDDKTVNPRITIMANYKDGSSEHQSTFGIKKDGKKYSYEVKIKTDEQKKLTKITGWVLDNSTGTESKHVDVYDISLKYSKE